MEQPPHRSVSVALSPTARNPSAPAEEQLSQPSFASGLPHCVQRAGCVLAPLLAVHTGARLCWSMCAGLRDAAWMKRGERYTICRIYLEVFSYITCFASCIPSKLQLWISRSVTGLLSRLILPVSYPRLGLYLTKAPENRHLCLISLFDTFTCKAEWYKVLKIKTNTKIQIWK